MQPWQIGFGGEDGSLYGKPSAATPAPRSVKAEFRKLGFVRYNNGGIRIHSSLLNVVLNDQPHIVRDQIGDGN